MKNKTTAGIFALLFILICSGPAEAEQHKFAWLSIAPEIGYLFFSANELDDAFPRAGIGNRHGMVVKAHVDIGGKGGALEIAPLYALEFGKNPKETFHAFGGELTLVHRFRVKNVYPGIGIGFHAAALLENETIQSGVQLYGRVPFGVTWYFMKFLGLVLESGFLFGTTGIHYKESDTDSEIDVLAAGMEYAFTLGLDVMVGLRFP